MSAPAKDLPPKAVLRVLRFLERGGGRAAVGEAGEGGCALCADTRTLNVDEGLLRACRSAGLVELASGSLTLRPEGAAHLRRALHPEAQYATQHRDLERRILRHGDERAVLVNEAESPLARLYLRKDAKGRSWLDERQFEAGERFRRDFERGGLQPGISANWETSVGGRGRGHSAGRDLSDFALDARRRLETAISALEPSLAGVVLDICCFLKGLEQVERERGWPPRSAKLMLRTALSSLADHYGGPPRRKGPQMRHWGEDGYRPSGFTQAGPTEPPA